MKKYLLVLTVLFVCPMASKAQTFIQAYADIVNQCSQTNITNSLTEFEALGVKRRGTTALQNTLDWLKNKYLSYGYTASQLQEFSYTYSGSTAACKNLVVTKIGTTYPNTYVIICGHYDSIVGTGTNDNGSGVASILEVARLLRNVPTEYSIKFINFSGEEDGLKGSQNYVTTVVNGTSPKMNIRLLFNLDEVGGVAGLTNDTITCERDTSTPTTNNAASNTFTNELIACTELYSPLNTFLSYAYASDYMSFQSNNEVITGFFETNETTHKHTATDLLVNMDPVYNYNVAKAAIGAMLHFAVASTTPLNTIEQNDYMVSVFPNPATNEIYLNLGSLPQTHYTFSLLDIHGKTVFSQVVDNAPLMQGFSVSHLARGMYLGILETEGQRITKKIVLE
ncbi:M28 family peptidase [Flavobacterium stagni]|uniref:M28 family peptidase n=1 Tax=Flavobacterium stagni TaxID=2506421 RepID=A0A4Q1KBB7_9FLAO|nr:M28 family peptidase [Flavobacterium stagni]RXR23378.1 M28 family peptidase [Flavobacterium stagni]